MRSSKWLRYGALLILSGWMTACQLDEPQDYGETAMLEELSPAAQAPRAPSEDFDSFYERFLADASFQVDRILFPLEGIPDNAWPEEMDGSFRWTEAEWEPHRPLQSDSDFEVERQQLSPDLVTERIIHKSGQYGMLRRFARLDNTWMLIYYAGLNSLEN